MLRRLLVPWLRLRPGVVAAQGTQPSASVGVVVCQFPRQFLSHRLTWRSSGTGRKRLRLRVPDRLRHHPLGRPLRPAPYLYVRHPVKAHVSVAALQVILAAAFPTGSQAAGFPFIEGRMPGGVVISIDVDTNDSSPNVYLWRKLGKKREDIQTFEREPCIFSEVTPTGEYLRTLTCSKTARSPLAGAKYVARHTHGSCEHGEPEFLFTCVSGCNSSAPKTLTQGHWEC